ncbi:MAG: hypothetical protein JSV96_09930 [Candidatus Aminicenantes bacterium]|nr:MAG: hypothetical protein JSV96_09930 [Candidatus Aminicenantes bacterium]
MNILKRLQILDTNIQKRITFLLESWGIIPEPEDLELQIVRKIARSKDEFEKLKADLESQGYTIHIQEFFEEETDRKNFFASILAEKELPEKKIERLPLKKHYKLLRKKEMLANIIMKTFWIVVIGIVILFYLFLLHPLLLTLKAAMRL